MGPVQGELTTARQLTAELLPVAGNVITGDALYCQRDYCQQLLDAGGDYLVIVKKNQRELYDAIALAFAEPVWGAQYRQARRRGRHGGRWETRQLRATEALNEYLDWPGVRQVCQVRRRVEQKGSVSPQPVMKPKLLDSCRWQRASWEPGVDVHPTDDESTGAASVILWEGGPAASAAPSIQ